ncbi:MAG: ABC transporter permease [Deltaproteobacteria bacterium]|nr:ABC transporter permease [Deltaproteobacteria bacterium]
MTVSSPLAVQGRVIWALMLREIHTLYGDARLGYLWALINTGFGVCIFWLIRSFTGFRPPHGMSTVVFLVAGFTIWHIVSNTVTRSMAAVSGNRALLTFPQVTPLDVMLARIGVITATQIVVGTILIAVSLALDQTPPNPDWTLLLCALGLTVSFGLAMGSLLAAFNVIFPVLEKIVPLVMRLLFFASGVFFSVRRLPPAIQKYLAWNPILQIIELTRKGLNPNYPAPPPDPIYLALAILIPLTLGLLLERYVRTYVK